MSRDRDETLSGSVPAQYGNKKHVVIRTATEMRSVHTRFIRTDIPDNELQKGGTEKITRSIQEMDIEMCISARRSK